MGSVKKQQLTLPLSLPTGVCLQDYVAGANGEVVDYLRGVAKGEQGAAWGCYLAGQPGLGKTHLLVATAEAAINSGRRAMYLDLECLLATSQQALLELEFYQLLCIDNLDAIQRDYGWQQGLFDLINRVLESGHQIVFAATAVPKLLQFELADLVSRLEWGVLFKLRPLSDEDLVQAILGKCASKGLQISAEAATFVVRHQRRDMQSLVAVLDKLDQLSLQSQRRLTIPFIKDALKI